MSSNIITGLESNPALFKGIQQNPEGKNVTFTASATQSQTTKNTESRKMWWLTTRRTWRNILHYSHYIQFQERCKHHFREWPVVAKARNGGGDHLQMGTGVVGVMEMIRILNIVVVVWLHGKTYENVLLEL